jgi:hypothetical protein
MEIATGLIQVAISEGMTKHKETSKQMVVRLKGITIDAIEDAESKKLRMLKMSSKTDGVTMTLELPEALCGSMRVKDTFDIIIDAEPIAKGDSAKLYAEGTVFKVNETPQYEVIGTIGGLRLVFSISNPTPSQRKTFESDRFFLTLN